MSHPLSQPLTKNDSTWYLAAAKGLLRALAALLVSRPTSPVGDAPWCTSLASCLRAGGGETQAGGSPPSRPVQHNATHTSNHTSNSAARSPRPDSPAWGPGRHQESQS